MRGSRSWAGFLVVVGLLNCRSGGSDAPSQGGNSGGGAEAGSAALGGASASAGGASAGGQGNPTGGKPVVGGAGGSAAGGTGGSGGAATGGVTTTGGKATGGRATGGTSATGGKATGGASATGGATGTGGFPPGVSPKKGVGAWFIKGIDTALVDLKVSWYYDWGPSPDAQAITVAIPFVPMIWDETHVTAGELAEVKKHGNVLLGFNEPDHGDQANMTVAQALDLWPQLQATGMRLGSPAPANNPAQSGSWLEQFMAGAKTRGYRVDFICVHWYGSSFDAATATSQLKSFLQAVHTKFGLPIWLTEYSLIVWSSPPTFPTWAQSAAFATQSVAMLETLPFVERFAWFSLPKYTQVATETGFLYEPNPVITQTGSAYRAAGVH